MTLILVSVTNQHPRVLFGDSDAAQGIIRVEGDDPYVTIPCEALEIDLPSGAFGAELAG